MELHDDESLDDLPLAQVNLSEMNIDEIEELLSEFGSDLSDDDLHQVALFMKQLGSFEAAWAAIAELNSRAA